MFTSFIPSRLSFSGFFIFLSFFSVHSLCQSAYVYKTIENISYYPGLADDTSDYRFTRCRLDLYYPANKKGFTTVIWFHGGGMTGGEKYIPEGLKEKGIAVIAANYRLNPNVKCPAYIEDAAAAAAWAYKNINSYGGDSAKIIISGHSAGGYLTLMIGLDKRWLGEFNVDANKFAALAPFSPQVITHFTIRKERNIPELQPLIDEYAPLYHIRKDAPPILLFTGDREQELLARYEENLYMWRMLKNIGHKNTKIYEIGGFNHGDMVAPGCLLLLKYLNENGL